jgi:hypothetical protein
VRAEELAFGRLGLGVVPLAADADLHEGVDARLRDVAGETELLVEVVSELRELLADAVAAPEDVLRDRRAELLR